MDWLLGLIPWWVYAIAALAVIVAVWRIWGWRGAVLAIGASLAFLSYRRGRDDQRTVDTARLNKDRTDAMKNRKEIDDATVGMDSTSLDRELDRWMRD